MHFHRHHRHGERHFARPTSDWNDLGLSGRPGGRRGRYGRHGGDHGGDRQGGDHQGGERHGRLFDHGELRFVVLHLIAEKPRHGYEIIKAIEEHAGGTYSPSPGVIYPTLTMLEELGYTTLAEQDGKKLYALTEAGAAYLRENQRTVEAIAARLAASRRGTRRRPGAADHPRGGEPAAGAAPAPVARRADRGAGPRRCRSARRRGHGGGAVLSRVAGLGMAKERY